MRLYTLNAPHRSLCSFELFGQQRSVTLVDPAAHVYKFSSITYLPLHQRSSTSTLGCGVTRLFSQTESKLFHLTHATSSTTRTQRQETNDLRISMEEHVLQESCRIVYFCSSAQDDVHELYHKNSPPEASSDTPTPLQSIYRNVRALLDEDQGSFDEGRKNKL